MKDMSQTSLHDLLMGGDPALLAAAQEYVKDLKHFIQDAEDPMSRPNLTGFNNFIPTSPPGCTDE